MSFSREAASRAGVCIIAAGASLTAAAASEMLICDFFGAAPQPLSKNARAGLGRAASCGGEWASAA